MGDNGVHSPETFKATAIVDVMAADGSLYAKVPVKLDGFIDEYTREESFTAEELFKIDDVKRRYAELLGEGSFATKITR